MLKDLTIPNCHGLRMPRSRNMPIPKATSGPFCSRFDPHKTKMEDQAATDRSVDIEGRGCKAVSGNCCCIPSTNSASVLSYQWLPTSIQCGEAMARRRKEDGRVGSAS